MRKKKRGRKEREKISEKSKSERVNKEENKKERSKLKEKIKGEKSKSVGDVKGSFFVGFQEMLKDDKGILPNEMPQGLPPLSGVEHHIDLIVGTSLPNRPIYRANLEETKEI
ncbi:hypothetical protein CR513_11674, partial [Mucuna pruriens]